MLLINETKRLIAKTVLHLVFYKNPVIKYYYSDLGDPFQSVGESNTPKKVKLLEDDDKEGVDKLREVRGQDVMSKDDLEKFINPIAVARAFAMAARGVAAGAVSKDEESDEQQKQVSAEIGVPGEVESRQDRGVISIEDDEEPEEIEEDIIGKLGREIEEDEEVTEEIE